MIVNRLSLLSEIKLKVSVEEDQKFGSVWCENDDLRIFSRKGLTKESSGWSFLKIIFIIIIHFIQVGSKFDFLFWDHLWEFWLRLEVYKVKLNEWKPNLFRNLAVGRCLWNSNILQYAFILPGCKFIIVPGCNLYSMKFSSGWQFI